MLREDFGLFRRDAPEQCIGESGVMLRFAIALGDLHRTIHGGVIGHIHEEDLRKRRFEQRLQRPGLGNLAR